MPSRTWADLDAQVQRALEKLQSQTERRILREYAAALKKIRNDMGKLYEKLAAPDGTLSLAEMTKYNRFNTLEKQIAGIMKESNGIVVSELARLAPEMYNESYFRYAWAFDQNTGVALSWGPVQRDALLAVSTNQMDKIAKDTLATLTRNRIRGSISQGLLQGSSYPQMARNIRSAMNSNAFEAMRIARTEGQRAQNAGIDDLYTRAADNGIQGPVIWDATLDSRTRPTTAAQARAGINHRVMDGVEREPDGLFTLPNGERAPHPVAPTLSAGQAINCRCRLRKQVDDYAPALRRTREGGLIPYTTYSDWQEGKVPSPEEFVASLKKMGLEATIVST